MFFFNSKSCSCSGVNLKVPFFSVPHTNSGKKLSIFCRPFFIKSVSRKIQFVKEKYYIKINPLKDFAKVVGSRISDLGSRISDLSPLCVNLVTVTLRWWRSYRPTESHLQPLYTHLCLKHPWRFRHQLI